MISNDCVLVVDEMCLEKATQYHSGEYGGADDEGNLYKGIVVFMISRVDILHRTSYS